MVSQPEAYKKPVLSVGDEFMAWAETYWEIDKKYEGAKDPQNNFESCPYSLVREIFVRHINEIISHRINNYL